MATCTALSCAIPVVKTVLYTGGAVGLVGGGMWYGSGLVDRIRRARDGVKCWLNSYSFTNAQAVGGALTAAAWAYSIKAYNDGDYLDSLVAGTAAVVGTTVLYATRASVRPIGSLTIEPESPLNFSTPFMIRVDGIDYPTPEAVYEASRFTTVHRAAHADDFIGKSAAQIRALGGVRGNERHGVDAYNRLLKIYATMFGMTLDAANNLQIIPDAQLALDAQGAMKRANREHLLDTGNSILRHPATAGFTEDQMSMALTAIRTRLQAAVLP
jgi:hypothetical protein